ncbi:MAG: hypothetical protein ACO3XN_08500, partial [Chthoniobacterales bacterium]
MKTTLTLLTALLLVPLASLYADDSGAKTTHDTKGAEKAFSRAVWIGVTTGSEKKPNQNIHYAFRHKLPLDDKPSAATVRVTADARYILWVNGAYVGRGP